jgi:four helix bundle protein
VSNTSSKKFDLEDRLVVYAGEVALFFEKLPKTFTCDYYGKQLVRSSGSTALNFGEFQGTISDKDYIHKITLSIKELKESRVSLRVLRYIKAYDLAVLDNILDETEQIIAIFSKIVINRQNKMNSKP